MNELLQKVVQTAKDNKALLIKAGSTLAGSLIGAVVGTIVANQVEETEFFDSLDEVESAVE